MKITNLLYAFFVIAIIAICSSVTAQISGVLPWLTPDDNYGHVEDSVYHRETITAYKLEDGDVIAIDGNRETVWDKYPAIHINRAFPSVGLGTNYYPGPEDLNAQAKIAYDDNNLYMFVEVFDDFIMERSESPGSYDFEHKFDFLMVHWSKYFPYNPTRVGTDIEGLGHWAWNTPDGDRRYDFLAGNDSIYDWLTNFTQAANQTTGAFPSNIDFKYVNTGNSYIFEIKFPWVDALSVTDPVEPGNAFTMDILIEDGDDPAGTREHLLAAVSNNNNVYAWRFFTGKLVLGNKYPSEYNTGVLPWFNSGNDFLGVLPDTMYRRNDISAYKLPFGESIVIDGAIDPIWDRHPELPLDKISQDAEWIKDTTGDISAWSKIVYDEDYLYILFKVNDDDIREQDHVPITMDERFDLVEISWGRHFPYNPDQKGKGDGGLQHWAWNIEDGDRKYDFYAGCDTIYDWRSNFEQVANQTEGTHAANIDFKYVNNGSHYIWEIKLPWSEALAFKDGVRIGEVFSFDLTLEDRDEGVRENKLALNSEWNDLYAWRFYSGRLQLLPEYTQQSIADIVWVEPVGTDGTEEITLTFDPRNACVPEWAESLIGAPQVGIHSSAVLEEDPDASWYHIIQFDQPGVDGTSPVLTPNEDGTYSMTFTPSLFYGTGDAPMKGISAVFNDGNGWTKEGKAFGANGCKDFYIPLGLSGGNVNALLFDGVDDWVNINKALTPLLSDDAGYTIEAWMKTDAYGVIAAMGYADGWGPNNVLFNMYDSRLGYWDWDFGYSDPIQIPLQVWQHVALSVDPNGEGKIYRNGSEAISFSNAHFPAPGGTMSLGMEYDGVTPSDFFSGTMDNVMVWKTSRTPEEILSDLKMEVDVKDSNLVAFYTFEDINGNIVPDKSSYGNDGILNNGPRIVPSYANQIVEPEAPKSLKIHPMSAVLGISWEVDFIAPGQKFNIYLDDPVNLIGSTSGTNFNIYGLEAETEYTIYINSYNILTELESPKVSVKAYTLGSISLVLAPVNPVIDGVIDSIWNTLNTTNTLTNPIIGGRESEEDLSSQFRTMWTSDSLYVLVEITDDILSNTGNPNTWEDDYVELYLDLGNEKLDYYEVNDFQIRFNYDSPFLSGVNIDILGGNGADDIHFSEAVTTDGYLFEIAIAWSTLNLSNPPVGKLIGMDMIVGDNDGAFREFTIGWSTLYDDAWHDTRMFATMELVEVDSNLNLFITTQETYSDIPDGYILVNVQGGTPPYHYLWSTGDTVSDLRNILPGIYSLIVTDAANNSKSVTILVGDLGPFYSKCGPGFVEIMVEVMTDGQGNETMWMIKVADTAYYSVNYGDYDNNQLYSHSICVPENEDINFTIFDFNGDGICCLNGEGYYKVTSSCATLAEGGEFSSFESATFQVTGYVEQAEFLDILGVTGAEVINSVIQTCEGEFVAAGYTDSKGAGKKDVYLIKTDGIGDTLWTKTYGDAEQNYANDIVQTDDGGFMMLGEKVAGANRHLYLVKTNKDGVQQWTKTHGFFDDLKGLKLLADPDSGYYILADHINQTLIVRMEDNGDTLWTKSHPGTPADMVLTADGGYAVLSFTDQEGAGGTDLMLKKMNSSGMVSWSKTYGGSFDEQASAIDKTFEGGYIIAGTTEVTDGNPSTWVIKTDYMGNKAWDKKFGGEKPTDILQTFALDYVVSLDNPTGPAYLVKLNPSGTQVWRKKIGFGTVGNHLYDVDQTQNGGFIIGGSVVNSTMIPDALILRTNSSGTGCYARPYEEEELCLVTIDPETEKNLVVWEKTAAVGTGKFNVYRETTVSGEYNLIGEVPFGKISQFVDSTSTPKNKVHRYKITAVDTCGNESGMSGYHSPLLLTVTELANDAGFKLDWTDYVVENGALNFKTYYIYGGTDSTDLALIDSVAAGTQNQYPDFRKISRKTKYYYRVAGVLFDECAPTGELKAGAGPYSHSLSNQEDNRLQVSPNNAPADISLSIATINEGLPAGTLIGRLSTVDEDTLDTHAYSLVAGTGDDDNSKFTIQGDSLLSAEVFDFDDGSSLSILIRTSDDDTENSLSYDEAFTITVNEIIGISSYGDEYLKIYPNPFTHSTTIVFPNPEGTGYQLIVRDLSGKVVRMEAPVTNSKHELDRGNLEKGLYLLELRGDRIFRGRMVVD